MCEISTKVALLLFKSIANNNEWKVRLIISTGNWTTETLSDSLDIVCCLNLASNDFRSSDINLRQIRADIFKSWEFLKWLRDFFSISILTKEDGSENSSIFFNFEKILNAIAKPNGINTRFFDNRKNSLLHQLPNLIIDTAGKVKRNYLALGSGFYQSPTKLAKIPTVINEIFNTLLEEDLLIKNSEKDIFINPLSCQAIAGAKNDLQNNCWTIREANDPLNQKRSLHAKFIFSANRKEGYNSCSSSWVYLGSGNLTEAGFTTKSQKGSGNLETGILLSPGKLFWNDIEKDIKPYQCLEKILPLQWDYDINDFPIKLQVGDEFSPSLDDFIAPPIGWLKWQSFNKIGLLLPCEKSKTVYQIISFDKSVCTKDGEGNWIWQDGQPSEVVIKWGEKFQFDAIIPVVDSFGRIAGKKLELINLEEAWWQLEGYPNPVWEEDSNDEVDGILMDEISRETRNGTKKTESYPIRKMMELVEKIADKNTSISESDWKYWCNRLEQSLVHTKEAEEYELFREMKLNPFSPLRDKAFRPDFAVDSSNSAGKYYEDVLDRIEQSLNLIGLNHL